MFFFFICVELLKSDGIYVSGLFSQLLFSLFLVQLQKRKEREEQLEDVIQAYEKIHMEKNNLQRDLDKMVRGIIQLTALYISYFLQYPNTSVTWLIYQILQFL